jgi:hypothetical protein
MFGGELARLVPAVLVQHRRERGAGVTPEGRAADVIHRATELGLVIQQQHGPKWHSLIAAAITDALVEARGSCSYTSDRDAISDLMIGRATVAGYGPPNTAAGVIECFVCEGAGKLGAVDCHACAGKGIIADSGAPPNPNPGLVAIKPCGCATDWVGSAAPDQFRQDRVNVWAGLGYVAKAMDFLEAGPLITQGAACSHERRATPRDERGVLDLTDMAPGGGA